MRDNTRGIIQLDIKKLSALCLALIPVLSPYILLRIGSGVLRVTFRVTDVFLIIIGIWAIQKGIPKVTQKFLLFYSGFVVFTILALNPMGMGPAIKMIVCNYMYIGLFSLLWNRTDPETFFGYACKIGVIVSIVALLQFVGGNLGLNVWDGRLPFLEVQGHWAGYWELKSVRPNSIFQESSYIGVYLLPCFAYCLNKSKYKMALLTGCALLFSSSLIAIAGIAMVLLYFILISNAITLKRKVTFLLVLFLIILAGVFLASRLDSFSSLLDYITRRILNIAPDLDNDRMGSTRYRLTGFSSLFEYYSPWQKIFGVGENMYGLYFGLEKAYGNNFVIALMNFGIVGLTYYIGFCLWLLFKLNRRDRVYALIFILISATDYTWFSYRFFYLMTPVVVMMLNKSSDSSFDGGEVCYDDRC